MNPKIFKAYDVRAVYPDDLNEEAAWGVGFGAGTYLAAQEKDPEVRRVDTVLVSRDMRPSSPALAGALIEGINAAGMNVIDLGMCDTSFQYFAVNHMAAAGGVQVTASHNPIQYNGFKVSKAHAKPVGAETGLNEIKEIALTAGARGSKPAVGKTAELDLWGAYRDHVLSFIKPRKRSLKVFIDASNGMAGKMVPNVFDGVDNLEMIRLNFEITGSFVHEPNPLVAENMLPTQEGVREHGADLGVCFDGDADRCILTDEKGEIIGCDHLTALLSGYFLDQAPGSTVVYDLRSSKAVEEAVESHGGKTREGRVGHVFMKQALRETEGVFGGELSGHFYFRDNFYADSGAIAFAAVLSLLGNTDKSMSELVAPFKKYPQSGEMNFRVEDKVGVMNGLKTKYAGRGDVKELDGVSIDCWASDGAWFNVRASNTEPLLRLNAEAKTQAALDALLADITPMLGEPDAGH